MTVLYQSDHPRAVHEVCDLLRSGKIGAIPTETVYGLAADIQQPQAVEAVFQAKGRPAFDPLIVHVASQNQAETVARFNPLAHRLADLFWPGPLTLVLPKTPSISSRITANLNTVAVRCPAHPIMREVLMESGLSLAAPSANPFGRISPTQASHVLEHLNSKIDFVLDGGSTQHGLESTILKVVESNSVEILRPGPINSQSLKDALPELNIQDIESKSETAEATPAAPGMLDRHYSPATPLALFGPTDEEAIAAASSFRSNRSGKKVAWVFLQALPHDLDSSSMGNIHFVAQGQDMVQVGRRLYTTLHELDKKGFDLIYFQTAPDGQLGDTINDRLARAEGRGK